MGHNIVCLRENGENFVLNLKNKLGRYSVLTPYTKQKLHLTKPKTESLKMAE